MAVSPVQPPDKISPTLDSDSSDEGLTYGDDSMEETNNDTETSMSSSGGWSSAATKAESPPTASTLQEVKDYMNSNADLKFLISEELSKTEEFRNFMDSKKSEEDITPTR